MPLNHSEYTTPQLPRLTTPAAFSAGIMERVGKAIREDPSFMSVVSMAVLGLLGGPFWGLGALGVRAAAKKSGNAPTATSDQDSSDQEIATKAVDQVELEIRRAIECDPDIIDFMSWKSRINSKTEIGSLGDIKQDFMSRMMERGYDAKTSRDSSNVLSEILAEKIPDLDAITAVRELRQQFLEERVPSRYRIEGRPRYFVRESGVDPITFLMKHYGDELRAGTLGPGQIQAYDANLYMSLRKYLQKQPPGGAVTIAELFASYSEEGRSGSNLQRRIRACAAIIGTDEAQAARFLSGIRPDRVRTENEEREGPQR